LKHMGLLSPIHGMMSTEGFMNYLKRI